MARTTRLEIRVDDLTDRVVVAFLDDHIADLRITSPPESTHTLDLDALRSPAVTVWTAWEGEKLVGCCALAALDARHAELKSMRTTPRRIRSGIASVLLTFVVDEARLRRYRRLSLETGSMDDFEPARKLYAKHGFEYCAPFGDYVDDPNSVFMTKAL
ncbi:GNAT family N-acetyltransferase [Antrihabitans stalagmiti]|uniref:GNAT family N-acetyltransferase n=1 Tax=Antrihabitans stalagmiti TaxID=2799499 RepID=UPI0027DB60E5|nr:GNAT family N-acetyltransferase [Antrihabitans stalagmiti]